MNMKIDWELSWIEAAEMAWWEVHPDATEEEFHLAYAASTGEMK